MLSIALQSAVTLRLVLSKSNFRVKAYVLSALLMKLYSEKKIWIIQFAYLFEVISWLVSALIGNVPNFKV